MLPWPTALPPLDRPTLTDDPRCPVEYLTTLAAGQWCRRWFCPTPEPTSFALDGAPIFALLAPGPGVAQPPLTPTLVPFAVDGPQFFCFDYATTPPSIRYVDTEVDQWLPVAPDFTTFMARLTWRPPILDDFSTAQQQASAWLVADAASLPGLFEWARTTQPADWLTWLGVLRHDADPARAAAAQAELTFIQDFLRPGLTAAQRAQLAAMA